MTNRFAKLEERLARLEEQLAPKGRFITRWIVADEADPECDAFIAAEHDRLMRDNAPIMPEDHVQLLVSVMVHPPDYDENGEPIPGTGSRSATAGRASTSAVQRVLGG